MIEPMWWYVDKALEVELGRRVCSWLTMEDVLREILSERER